MEDYVKLGRAVKEAFEGVGSHNKSKFHSIISEALSPAFRQAVLGLTPVQSKSAGRKQNLKDAKEHFAKKYPPNVTRKKICDLEVFGWTKLAKKFLQGKSGPTAAEVYFLRKSKSAFFFQDIVANAWMVPKFCWEEDPDYDYTPSPGCKETVFQRSMRVYKECGEERCKVVPPSDTRPTPSGDGSDELYDEAIPDILVTYYGPDKIICRSLKAFWNMIDRDRGNGTG